MEEKQQLHKQLGQVESKMLCLYAKLFVVIIAVLSCSSSLLISKKPAFILIIGLVVLPILLFLLVRWWNAYKQCRKAFLDLYRQYKVGVWVDLKAKHTPLIILRRH
jgi:hypothetical protein